MDDPWNVGGSRPEAGGVARPALDRGERDVKDSVLRMGALVEAQIRAAVRALRDRDTALADAVIEADEGINEAQRAASERITTTIATQQPVARDLRFLLALDHVTFELERIGDHAAGIARQAKRLATEPPLPRTADLAGMGDLAAGLVGAVVRTIVDVDEDAARRAAVRDDEIDRRYREVFGELIELMRADPANVEPGARVLLAAHFVERIGDRATNIAEDVVYLATGRVEDLNP